MPERTVPSRWESYCLVCLTSTDIEELAAVELIRRGHGGTYLNAVCLDCAISIACRAQSPKSPIDEVWYHSP
jgi:hypothetical protein